MEELRNRASEVAAEHTGAFVAALAQASLLADQVANGGEAYHVGVREIARRMHSELEPTLLSLRAIHARGG
jgi:hypothetical protein